MNDYLCGLFDGEGSISICKRKFTNGRHPSYSVEAGISMTHWPTISWLKEMFGGKVILLNKHNNGLIFKRKKCWRWSVSDAKAKIFMQNLNGLKLKSPQLSLAWEFQERKGCWKLTNSEALIREDYYNKMKCLNYYGNSDNISNLSVGYVAGFFDAEGNVSVSLTGKTHSLYIQISNTNKKILETIKLIYGGNIKCVHGETDKNSALFAWYKTGPKAAAFLGAVYPHLKARIHQTELGLEFQKNKKHYSPLPEKEIYFRENYRQAIWRLNQTSSRSDSHGSRKIFDFQEDNYLFQRVDKMLEKDSFGV